MPRVVISLFGVFALLNIVASGLSHEGLDRVSKPFLLPLLAIWFWTQLRDRGILVALLFSFAGDVALMFDGTMWFIAGMGLFLCAHIAYITTFIRNGALTRIKIITITLYLVTLALALAWLWPGLAAQGMAIPMTAYGLALTTTAILSTTFGWRVGLGGGLFLLSDLLIAVRVADAATLPAEGAWVMLTYCLAQFLLAYGWVRYRRARD